MGGWKPGEACVIGRLAGTLLMGQVQAMHVMQVSPSAAGPNTWEHHRLASPCGPRPCCMRVWAPPSLPPAGCHRAMYCNRECQVRWGLAAQRQAPPACAPFSRSRPPAHVCLCLQGTIRARSACPTLVHTHAAGGALALAQGRLQAVSPAAGVSCRRAQPSANRCLLTPLHCRATLPPAMAQKCCLLKL